MKRSNDYSEFFGHPPTGSRRCSLHSTHRRGSHVVSGHRRLKKVPFPYSRRSGSTVCPGLSPRMLALSEKYGIDLDPVFIGASSALFQSMLSGAAEMAGSGGPAIIANILSGGDIIHITAMVPRFTQSVMVKSEIKRPEDMAGKKIGVSRLGTVTHFALQTALDGYGVKGCHDPADGRAARGAMRVWCAARSTARCFRRPIISSSRNRDTTSWCRPTI